MMMRVIRVFLRIVQLFSCFMIFYHNDASIQIKALFIILFIELYLSEKKEAT